MRPEPNAALGTPTAKDDSLDDSLAFEVGIDSWGDHGGPAALTLIGELDSFAAIRLGECLDRVDPRAPGLALDMTGVSFIDSSGLRTLIRARQMFPDDPAALRLLNPQPSTTRLLELTGLSDYFAVS